MLALHQILTNSLQVVVASFVLFKLPFNEAIEVQTEVSLLALNYSSLLLCQAVFTFRHPRTR